MDVSRIEIRKIVKLFLGNKIGVVPTDTVYGIHCLAGNKELRRKIAELKGRSEGMPYIYLIPKSYDIGNFDIVGDFSIYTNKYWPGPNTIIFPVRDGSTVALRVSDNGFLQAILEETGPLVSTSANPHKKMPARDVFTAKEYFGNMVDFYVDGGRLDNPPSNIYRVMDDILVKIR